MGVCVVDGSWKFGISQVGPPRGALSRTLMVSFQSAIASSSMSKKRFALALSIVGWSVSTGSIFLKKNRHKQREISAGEPSGCFSLRVWPLYGGASPGRCKPRKPYTLNPNSFALEAFSHCKDARRRLTCSS